MTHLDIQSPQYGVRVLDHLMDKHTRASLPAYTIAVQREHWQVYCSCLHVAGIVLADLSACIDVEEEKFNGSVTVTPFRPEMYRADLVTFEFILQVCSEAARQWVNSGEHFGWSVYIIWTKFGPEYEIQLHY